MRNFLMTLAIASVLSVPAYAGEVPSVGLTSPDPNGEPTAPNAVKPNEAPSVAYSEEFWGSDIQLIQMLIASIV